ncbi:MAG TPA: FkbM family methyltransferase [Xanthobacteraceae bacterium]|jgi:FkbM family methyltransferase|nr:FkbM family methyltransferase [Xanthobacteraceae bacterium]
MHFSLVIVGAHDGSKNTAMIDLANTKGRVLLIEPVPFLFARLAAKYGNNSNIILRNIAISLVDGEGSFLAPSETANTVHGWGDQLGSLLPDHAAKHDVRLVDHMESIKVQVMRFETLIRTESISSIECLLTDTEGMDADLLPSFPFSVIMPEQIIFEFKHADGAFRIGKKLGCLLIALDMLGYATRVLDMENMISIRSTVLPRPK